MLYILVGMFSYTMLAVQPIFCYPDWPRRIFNKLPRLFGSYSDVEIQPSTHCLYTKEQIKTEKKVGCQVPYMDKLPYMVELPCMDKLPYMVELPCMDKLPYIIELPYMVELLYIIELPLPVCIRFALLV